MPRDAQRPIELPAHLWQDPMVLALCRIRDATGLLRLAHKYGVTNECLAYWTDIDAGEISKRITGKTTGPVTTLDRWERLADGLGMPDEARVAVGLAPRRSPTITTPADPSTRTDTTSVKADDLDPRIDQARRAVRFMIEPVPPSAAADYLEQAADTAARAAVDTPPATMLAALLSDFETAQDLLRSSLPQRTRRRTIRAAALLATLIAEDLMILGRVPRSSQWFVAATQLAEAAGDATTAGGAATLQARLPLYFGEVAESVELARRAQDIASPANSFSASLGPMVEALALAQLGDGPSSLEALNTARCSFESQAERPDNETVFGFSRRRFLFYESRVLLDTGDLPAAWNAQEEALGLYPSAANGDVAILQLDRARLLVRRGEADEGCAHATRTLAGMPDEQRAPLFANRAWRVLASVPRSNRRSPAATELRDRLATTRETD